VSWIILVGLAVFLVAIVALTGFKARGTRPVAGSHLMAIGRVVLLILVVILAYLAFRARSGR
jgi:hypothetical protein